MKQKLFLVGKGKPKMESNPPAWNWSEIPTTGQFSMGRIPRRSNEQRRRLRNPKPAKKSGKNSPESNTKSAFPLSPTKTYSFVVNFALSGFPRSSVQAVQHFHKLIAPPLQTNFFSLKPADIQQISKAFFENIQARWAFRKLVLQFLQRKFKQVNDVDPMTLEPFQHPIDIHSFPTKSIYRFESKSLANAWKSNLLAHDGIFPEPKFPLNPLTNLPFNLLQIHTAQKQMKANGHTNWILESFSSCCYNLPRWQKKFTIPLRLETIQQVFDDKSSFDRYDMLMDFVELQHEYHDISFNKGLYKWIFQSRYAEEYANLWVKACKKFYLEKFAITEKEDLEDLEIRTSVWNAYLMEVPQIVKIMYYKYLDKKRENGSRCLQNRVIQN